MISPAPPFRNVLVPYDGSEPARAALRLALGLAKHGARITIVNVVDASTIVAESAATMGAFDPTQLYDALDIQAAAVTAEARALCRAESVDADAEVVHDTAVMGILACAKSHASDLIVAGTHARRGMARTFLGSTTEGILRGSRIPVLTVRSEERVGTAPFAVAVVAVDDSHPADAAVAVAAHIRALLGTTVVACHVIDTTHINGEAAVYGFTAAAVFDAMKDDGRTTVREALARAALPADTAIDIAEGEPVEALLAVATQHAATIVIAGTHGRRGLRRFFLGSVAERLVRTSDLPVLIVPATPLS